MKKLIFIDVEPLTPRRIEIFQIDALLARGFQVAYWDISQYFDPGKRLADTLSRPYVQHITSLAELRQALNGEQIDQCLFSCEVPGDRISSLGFFRVMERYGTLRIRIGLYTTAFLNNTLTLREKLRHATLRKVLKSLINRTESIVWALYRRLSGLHLYRYYISSGNNPCIDVHINHPDWELYRQMRSEPSLINNPYALFLDEFYPLHPDTQYHNRGEKTGDVKTYQSSLCRFFDHLEIPIVIAAHPKAEYSPDTFGSGREIIKYRSAQLVSHAEAVFMHNTASAAFVIMNDRPLALITNDSYNRQTTLRIAQQRLAKILDLEIYNIDQCDPTNIKLRHIDDEIRRNYIYSYLTTPQVENTPNIEILDKFFRSL